MNKILSKKIGAYLLAGRTKLNIHGVDGVWMFSTNKPHPSMEDIATMVAQYISGGSMTAAILGRVFTLISCSVLVVDTMSW